MQALFDHVEWETAHKSIATFYFRPVSRYRYEAGQYAIFSLPHAGADNRGNERTMTLSSSPLDRHIAFTCKIYTNGSSFKRALLALKPGDPITVFESMGDLVLPLSASIPLVFVAGGIGIASFVGMTRFLRQTNDTRQIDMFYLVRPADICLQKPFDDYPLTRSVYTPSVKSAYVSPASETILTSAKPPQNIVGERLDVAAILQVTTAETFIYLSGTEALIADLRQALEAAGVQRSQIIFDYFDGYSEL